MLIQKKEIKNNDINNNIFLNISFYYNNYNVINNIFYNY